MATTSPASEAPGSVAATVPVESDSNGLSERGLVLVAALGHFVCHMGELTYTGVAVAIMAEFGLSEWQGASLGVLGWILLGVGALPVGLWADAWGPDRVYRLYFPLMALAALLVAASLNVLMLLITLTLIGLAASIYHPVGLALLSIGVKARGKAMGINGVAGNVGIALGPAIGIAFCFAGWWRLAYVIVALISLASFGALLWLTRQGRTLAGIRDVHAQAAAGKSSPDSVSQPSSLRAYLPLILLYAAMVCGGFNYRFFMTAAPPYVSGKTSPESLQRSSSRAATVDRSDGDGENTVGFDALNGGKIFLVLLIGGVGQFAGGWLVDRFGAKYVYPLMIACVIPLSALVGWIGGGGWVLFPACMLAICMFGLQPVENTVLAEKTSRGRRGLSYAAKFTLAFGFGALGASVAGIVWETLSIQAVFFLMAATSAAMATLAAVALWRPDPIGASD